MLFINARKLAVMISRVQRELTNAVIDRVAGTVATWRGDTGPRLSVFKASFQSLATN